MKSSQDNAKRQALPFVPKVSLWLVGAATPVLSMILDILMQSPARVLGRDFTNLWTGGKLAIVGQSSCAFDVKCFRQALESYIGIISTQNYSYPPHAFFIDIPFALFPYYIALFIWTVFGVIFFCRAARPYLPSSLPPLLAALTPAGLLNIWDGQFGYLFGGLWLIVFWSLERRQFRAGVSAALMTFKPHLGVLLALVMLWRGRWSAIGGALVITVLWVSLSVAAFGFENWSRFFSATTRTQVDILTRTVPQFYFQMMPTVFPAMGLLVQIIFGVFAMCCIYRIRNARFVHLAFPVATATFLVLPYAFNYDMTVVCLGYAIIIYTMWDDLNSWRRALFILAFMTPQLTYISTAVVPFILAAALWEQVNLMLSPPSNGEVSRS